MVKISNTPHEEAPIEKQSPFTRTRLKIGALVAVGVLSLSVIGVVATGSDDESDTSTNAVAQDASDGFDYAAWSNPERLGLAEEDDAFASKGITVEGTVSAIINGSVNGFGRVEYENEHHILIALDGRNSQSVFVRYVSDDRTAPFEVGEDIVVTGVSRHLLGKDGIYVPSMEAEWVGEQ